jgi:CheY-like chemotaxis protein
VAADPGKVRHPHGHGQRILLLDDEPALTSVVQKMLRRLDYQVATSNSGGEAIRLVRESPAQFDLVITDLTMPEINGLEVARQIHAIRPELLVILVTGNSDALDAGSLRDAGICDLLQKPVSLSALAEAVQRVLENS